CGHSWLNNRVLIVDPETSETIKDDRVGEIWFSGPSKAEGYWGKSQLTKTTFYAYLPEDVQEPFLRTGDLGFMQNNELFITGRCKDLIIIRGRNYYPQDLEQAAEKSYQAFQPNCCAAFSIEEEGKEKLVIAQEIKREYLRKLNKNDAILSIRRVISEQFE